MSNSINNNNSDGTNYLEEEYFHKLNEISNRISERMTKLDSNFNKLKKDLFAITKDYEMSKQENKNLNNSLNSNESATFEDKLKEVFLSEHEKNIQLVDQSLAVFETEDAFKLSSNDVVTKGEVNNFQGECEQGLNEVCAKFESVESRSSNTLNTMVSEMNKEFENVKNLLDENSLELLNSNSDKASAIQDMLKIFINKFKNEKKEQNDFEEKIVKLIEELCNKLAYLKN